MNNGYIIANNTQQQKYTDSNSGDLNLYVWY